MGYRDNFDGATFVKDKYWSQKPFRTAVDAAADRTKSRTGNTIPNQPIDRIENYFNRLSEVMDREDPEKRERGLLAINRLVSRECVIKPEHISDDYIKGVLLGNQAELMGYQRDDLQISDIYQSVLTRLESQLDSSLETYHIPLQTRTEVENMTITDQSQRLDDWLSYLTGSESHHIPKELRY